MPTAFVCTDEQTALELREVLEQSKMNAFVMSIGNSPLTRWVHLPILSFDSVKLGRIVTQRLLKMMSIAVLTQDTDLKFRVEVL